MTDPVPLQNLDLWRPNQLQLVVFPMLPPIATEQEWWHQLTGQDPGRDHQKAARNHDRRHLWRRQPSSNAGSA